MLDWMVSNSRVLYSIYTKPDYSNKFAKEDLSFSLRSLGVSLSPSPRALALHPSTANSSLLDMDPTKVPVLAPLEIIRQYRLDRTKGHYVKKFCKPRACVGHLARKRTRYYCSFCGVFLCDEGCFIRFHEMRDYQFSDPMLSSTERTNFTAY